MAMHIGILGPVEVRLDGEALDVPAGKQRALLALLALRVPQALGAETIAEALWPGADPARASRSVQVTVSRLRRSLGPGGDAVETLATGYRLAVAADAIDAQRFERLVGAAASERDPAASRRLLDEALALWRGAALADVAFESFAQGEIARLDELRLVALEQRADACIAQGEHALVVPELEQLTADHPARERLLSLLMTALYRCGRQADALAVFDRGRRRLDEELGLQPSPELQQLQAMILRQDAALEAPPRRGEPERPTNLPPDPEALVGRESELEAVAALLTGDARLVTIVGLGGTGKTRLAAAAGERLLPAFAGGVWLVALAGVRDPDALTAEIAAAVDVADDDRAPLDVALTRRLVAPTLLVLDNFEQLVDAAPVVHALVERSPRTRVLVTSQLPLRLSRGARAAAAAARPRPRRQLFEQRARAAAPTSSSSRDRAAVEAICTFVDGMPLAIELAAARVATIAPDDLLDRMTRSLDVLARGPRDLAERHRSLRATLDWTYELLGEDERTLLARLAAFSGPAPLEAVEAIAPHGGLRTLDALSGLVDASLVRRDERRDHGVRYTLPQAVRDFAAEQPARVGGGARGPGRPTARISPRSARHAAASAIRTRCADACSRSPPSSGRRSPGRASTTRSCTRASHRPSRS